MFFLIEEDGLHIATNFFHGQHPFPFFTFFLECFNWIWLSGWPWSN
jgi:hypothetical protein